MVSFHFCLCWCCEFSPLHYHGNAPVAYFDQPAKRCSSLKLLLIEQEMGEMASLVVASIVATSAVGENTQRRHTHLG